MGNKQSSAKSSGSSSLHPQENRRLTTFLSDEKGCTKFTYSEIQRLWNDRLVPDLLSLFTDYLLASSHGQRNNIGLEDFISVYVKIIRGSSDEKASAIAKIIGSNKNQDGSEVISYERLCKYLSDLMESYFVGLETFEDDCYKSWTQTNQPQRAAIEEVMKGVCNDLQRTEDEVRVDLFERWLHESSLVNLLHCYVLGSMYNLQPEQDSTMIPLAHLPATNQKFSVLLDLSHVVYLNSFLPSEFKETWRFLFSTHSHGESFAKFIACIINQGPILIVVHTNSNNTFGGFISTNVILSPKWTGSETSFLFKLGPTVDVYPSTGYNDHYAYLNCHQTTLPNGLGMGGQQGYWGLWIDSHFGVGECNESCTTFKNYKMLDSQKKFHIKTIEVWGVGDPPPTEEERGERTTTRSGRSALDQDPTSTQILEMAGREMHSKGLRDSLRKKSKEH